MKVNVQKISGESGVALFQSLIINKLVASQPGWMIYVFKVLKLFFVFPQSYLLQIICCLNYFPARELLLDCFIFLLRLLHAIKTIKISL